MKFCPECGADVEGKRFCSECGVAINRDPATIEAAPIVNVIKSDALKEAKKEKIKQNLTKDNHKLIIGIVMAIIVLFIWSNVVRSGESNYSPAATQTTIKEISEPDFKAACVAQPYDDLARTPDSYKNMKLVITGKVVQVMEKSGGAEYRIAVDDNYDQMVYVDYTGDFAAGRILENDMVTLWGSYDGLMSYTATIGGKITVPSLIAKYYQITQ